MLNNIKKKFSSKDAKSLLENLFSLSILQVVTMVLPLVTLPYILRVIGFEFYGIIVVASSLVAYFQSITDYSFRITATRDVALFKNSAAKLNLIYSKVMAVKFIFTIFSLIIISAVVFLYPPFYKNSLVYFLTSLSLIGYSFFPEWFFQGIEKMKYITIINISIKLFFTLSIFVFIKHKSDFWIYPLLQSTGLILGALISQMVLLMKYKIQFVLISKKHIKKTIKSNFPIFINQFFPTLYNNTSTFLLGLLNTPSIVGMYQSLLIVINIGVTILEVFSRVFFPFLNRKKDAFKIYRKMMLIITIVMSIVLLSSYRLIFWYLHIKDENAFWVLLILTLGLFGYAFYNIYGLNYFIINKKDKLVMTNTIFSSIIGLIFSFPLIHFFGIVGTAINLSSSRVLMGGGLYYQYRKKNKNSL